MHAANRRQSELILALLSAALVTGCSSPDPSRPDDAQVDAAPSDSTVDSKVTTDATSPDAGLVDAGQDASADAAMCATDPLPLPSAPPCTDEEGTCFRACSDRDCLRACTFSPPCFECGLGASLNCALEWCPSELSAWVCCRESSCPPSGACPACDSDVAVLQSCRDAVFLPHCREAALGVCFP
jgi:hypothetical protein